MNKFLLPFLAFAFLSNVVFSQSTGKPDSKKQLDVKWLTHSDADCSVQYPANWELNTSGLSGTSFFMLSPLSSPDDQFRENINLLIQDLSAHDINLEQFAQISEGQVSQMLSQSKIHVSEQVNGKYSTYHRIIYSGLQDGVAMKFEQFYFLIEKKAFILTFTCAEADFGKYQETGERILESFLIK